MGLHGGNQGGRPTKLTDEMVSRAEKYVEDVQLQRITVKQGFDKDGETRWIQDAPMLPNHARLAFILNVDKLTMYRWQEAHEGDSEEMKGLRQRFRNCILRVKDLQESMLTENGSSGVFNPAVTNRILAAHHGYHEKIDTDHTSGGKVLNITIESPNGSQPETEATSEAVGSAEAAA